MFHMQERQLLLTSLYKKKTVHKAVMRFSCSYFFQKLDFNISCKLSPP